MEALGTSYANRINSFLNEKLYALLKGLQKDGHKTVIVSGSLNFWLKPWCDAEGFGLISTMVKVEDGVLTGQLIGNDCIGKAKAMRIKQQFDLSAYTEIIAFGNSRDDAEMLKLAHIKHFRYGL